MENLAVHIVLPKGLRLKNGAVLGKEVTFSVVSAVTPFYCSVDQVRLASGIYLTKILDLTIASQIYESSKDADSQSYVRPRRPPAEADPDSQAVREYQLFVNARQNWVAATAAKALILGIWDLAGTRGSKTLANFSVQRQALVRDEGFPKKINDLQAEADNWLTSVKSGGQIGPGGHARGKMAQKGMYNPDTPPGRLWITTGMGANRRTIPGYGSAGAPLKYSSAPIVSWRQGRFMGNYVAMFNPWALSVGTGVRPW
jgi:hypothetical protein